MISAKPRGIVSLLALLVLVTLATAGLSGALALRQTRATAQEETTRKVLAEARLALLGYAVRYPDVPGVAATGGPGRLPCPDLRQDAGEPAGTADSPCASRTGSTLGRLPWHTLGLPELRDASGAPLFYVVSDAYRAHLTGPINSDTRATLGVDTCTGESTVAAIVFAPGAAQAGQQRGPQSGPREYLEGVNAEAGTRCFTTRQDMAHNDRLITITHADLMRLGERRVRGEVAAALRRYRRAYGAYPWLAADNQDGFAGSPGLAEGRLPVRLPDVASADPLRIANAPVAFDAPFIAAWTLGDAGQMVQTGHTPPPIDCARDSVCSAGGEAAIRAGMNGWAPGRCKVQRPRLLACETFRDAQNALGQPQRRRVTMVLENWPHTASPPTRPHGRLQHFEARARRLASTPRSERLQLVIRDTAPNADGSETLLGETQLTLGPDDWLPALALREVPFDLEAGGEEQGSAGFAGPMTRADTAGALPYWLASNQWHPQLRLGFAHAAAPGESGQACSAHALGCLPVLRLRDASAGVVAAEAVVVSGGMALARHGQRRPSSLAKDFFEGGNMHARSGEPTLPGFELRQHSAAFNDSLHLSGGGR